MIDIFSTELGKKTASIILGIGFASMFRRICSNQDCMIVKGPKLSEMDSFYRIGDKCYKYNPYSINCPKKKESK